MCNKSLERCLRFSASQKNGNANNTFTSVVRLYSYSIIRARQFKYFINKSIGTPIKPCTVCIYAAYKVFTQLMGGA